MASDGLEYHHHTAKTYAAEAATLIREAENKLHACRALFVLAAQDDEPGNWREAAERAEELRKTVTTTWVGCAELGHF